MLLQKKMFEEIKTNAVVSPLYRERSEGKNEKGGSREKLSS